MSSSDAEMNHYLKNRYKYNAKFNIMSFLCICAIVILIIIIAAAIGGINYLIEKNNF